MKIAKPVLYHFNICNTGFEKKLKYRSIKDEHKTKQTLKNYSGNLTDQTENYEKSRIYEINCYERNETCYEQIWAATRTHESEQLAHKK